MPKATFHNLRPEKKEAVIFAALEEFALNDYANASITNMVKIIGIAKGSIYQYFDQKKGLYEYLIELATDTKLEYTKKILKQTGEGDFVKWYRKLLWQSLLFELEHPRYASLLKNVAQEKHNQEIGNLAEKTLKDSHGLLKKVIEIHQKNKTVDPSLDADTVAMILTHASYGFSDGFYVINEIDFMSHVRENEPITGMEANAKGYAKSFVKALNPIFT